MVSLLTTVVIFLFRSGQRPAIGLFESVVRVFIQEASLAENNTLVSSVLTIGAALARANKF